MNTERRHELEDNALAHGITSWTERLRPYTAALLGIAAFLLGIFIVGSIWNRYQRSRDQDAWYEYQRAIFQGDPEAAELQRLAHSEDHQGTLMQEWAFMAWADRQLLQASFQYLNDRPAAKERLSRIASIYGQIADNASIPELKNRARLGLARVSEMEGDLDEAKSQYALVDGALAAVAQERVKQLESGSADETIAWLTMVELPKRTPPGGPGTPGQRPGFEVTPPAADAKSGLNFDSTQSLEDIIGGIQAAEGDKRYGEDQAAADGEAATDGEAEVEAEVMETEPAEGAPSGEENAPPAAEAPSTEPATEGETPAEEESAAEEETPAPATPADQPAAQ